jgi:hypothetical protein
LFRHLLSRRAALGEALLLYLLDKHLERLLDDLSNVPVGYAMPQEILGLP